ncbi:MAG: chorismate mutase [Anaerolineae bacterium]|nr:chorismate mutase [Anaerolineae bacterium]
MSVAVRGVRGAITCEANTEEEILSATRELLSTLVAANAIAPEDVASALFSLTPDLDAAFPARAARDLGWVSVPLMCTREIPVPGALPRCVRVLLHWNTEKAQSEIVHLYLRGAEALRPDLAEEMQACSGARSEECR